jgi:hypothetical protein
LPTVLWWNNLEPSQRIMERLVGIEHAGHGSTLVAPPTYPTLSLEATGSAVDHLKMSIGRAREQICSLAVLEAFGNTRMVSGPIQHAKCESAGGLRIGAIG